MDKNLLIALIKSSRSEIENFTQGADVNKTNLPQIGRVYFANDTKKIYYCKTNGVWDEYSSYVDFSPQITKVLYADSNRTDVYTEDGSIIKPFKTIQAALIVATGNTKIQVAPGEYAGDFNVGVNIVEIIGSGLNATFFTGNITTSDRVHSFRYFAIRTTGSLTLNESITAMHLNLMCPVIVNGAAGLDGENLVISPPNGVIPLTINSTATNSLRQSYVYAQGDINSILQNNGTLILRGCYIVNSSFANSTVLSTVGILGFFENTIANAGGGAAVDMNNGGVALKPNTLSDINVTGNILCANATTIIGSINFIAVGALTGTALISNKAWKTAQVIAVDATDLPSVITLANELKSKMDIMNL